MQSSKARLAQFIGAVKLEHIPKSWQPGLLAFVDAQEEKDPRIKKVEIRGSQPHKSSDDPNEPEDVLSVRMHNEKEQQLGTFHVREDGTGDVALSRRGKSSRPKDGGSKD